MKTGYNHVLRVLGLIGRAACAWSLTAAVWGAIALTAAERAPAKAARGATPQFSMPSGVYSDNFKVQLKAEAGTIRYTLDGSEPTAASAKYSAPLEITNTTLLKAKILDSASAQAATASRTYIMVAEDLAAFDSNLPLVIINSFGQNIRYAQKTPVSVRLIDPQGKRSVWSSDANFDGRGELNIRGHTSLRYPKHSYHLKTKDEDQNPDKVPLLGMPEESDWVLYGPYPDKTLMRDVLGYTLSNEIGRYAPRTRFVELFLCESNRKMSQRDYLGIYVFVEKVKRSKNRVNLEKLTPKDNAEPSLSGGYLFKKDHTDDIDTNEGVFRTPASKQQGFTSSQGSHFYYVEPAGDEITPAQKSWLRQYVNSFERVLYGDRFKDPKTGYAAFIEPDSFIDHHLLVELTKNIDGFRFSTFYYKDRGGKLNMGPIWDWNLSFGNANGREGWVPEGWYWPQLDDQQYSWFRRLFEDPDFAQRYTDRWGELRTRQFSLTNIYSHIDQWAQQLDEAQARNFRRWRILGKHVHPNFYVGATFKEEITWMKQWIKKRLDWIDQQFPGAPAFSLKSGQVDRGAKLELRALAGQVYYTLDGSDPRASGGAVSASAVNYRAPITLNDPARVCTRALVKGRWSYPSSARFTVPKP
jgi:hypothetical protein